MHWFKQLVCYACGFVADELWQCQDCSGTYCDEDVILHEGAWGCPIALYNRTLVVAEQEQRKWKLFL